MGSVAPPYKGLPSMPTNQFPFVIFSLLRLVPFTNPSNMSMTAYLFITTRVQADERHHDSPERPLNIEFAAKI